MEGVAQLGTADPAAYLLSIQSNDIKVIEMIENPSARYDASGNAGIINIKLKTNKKFGANGNVMAGVNQGFYPKANTGVGLNYRNKKINLFSNVSGNLGKNRSFQDFNRQQNDSIYDARSNSASDDQNGNVKLGANYFINTQSTLRVMFTGNYANSDRLSEGTTGIAAQSTRQNSQVLLASNNIKSIRSNSNFTVNYRYVDTLGRELTIDADRGIYRGRGNSYQPNFYTNASTGLVLRTKIFANNTPTDIDIYTAKADYEQNFKKGKLGVGIKYAKVTTDHTFDFFNVVNDTKVNYQDRSNQFTYTENVNAGYVNYNKAFTKWSYQPGVRAEQTRSKGVVNAKSRNTGLDTVETVERRYLDFFAGAAISYTYSNKHEFNINYSRRIDRPGYQDLKPFENRIDELTYQKGNAFLQPQYTSSFSLSHPYKSFLTTGLSYSHIKDFFTVINDTAQGNAVFIIQKNMASQNIYGINISAPFSIANGGTFLQTSMPTTAGIKQILKMVNRSG